MAAVPISAGVRFLITAGLAWYQNRGYFNSLQHVEEVADFKGIKVTFVFERDSAAGTGPSEVEVTSLHFINTTGGNVDSTYTSDDLDAIDGACLNFWGDVKPFLCHKTRLRELRHYYYGPTVHPPNAAVRITTVDQPGTSSSGSLPPQIAATITLQTYDRKAWGRMYWPSPSTADVDEAGRFTTAFVDELAYAFQESFFHATALGNAGIQPCIYSPTQHSQLACTAVSVDDVPDVMRSRRFSTTGYRKTYLPV